MRLLEFSRLCKRQYLRREGLACFVCCYIYEDCTSMKKEQQQQQSDWR